MTKENLAGVQVLRIFIFDQFDVLDILVEILDDFPIAITTRESFVVRFYRTEQKLKDIK